MEFYLPFWSAFEEPSDERESSEETHTRTREEADHSPGYSAGVTVINMGTTKTSTREPSDQHPSSGGRGVVPRAGIRASQTITQAREEPDQDQSARGRRSIPRIDQAHA